MKGTDMLRSTLFAIILPASAYAQDFGHPPLFSANGISGNTFGAHFCMEEVVARGPDALVSPAVQECIGTEVTSCGSFPDTCAGLEQAFWEWRIARTYDGLQAWVADSEDVAPAVLQSVANPATATANVPLECQLRVTGGQGGEADPEALAICMMRETALIALELEFSVRQACETAEGGAFAAYCGRN